MNWGIIERKEGEDDEEEEAAHFISRKTDTRVDLEMKDLGLRLKGSGRSVLDGVTGYLRAGRLTALMGPSGAGKTTLLNTLSGRATYGDTCGTLLINGERRTINSVSQLVGFVPQDDVMNEELTVREILKFYASMRSNTDFHAASGSSHFRTFKGKPDAKYDAHHAHVEEVVQDVCVALGLSHIVDSEIGSVEKRGISGGQRKRVNVGMEMVSDPSLLFLDEPTSGLDSTTSYDLVMALKTCTGKGVNAIAVLHQPSYDLYKMFDDVMLLCPGGRAVYHGPSVDALDYFTGLGFELPFMMNPADFFMDVIAGNKALKGSEEEINNDFFVSHWNEERDRILALPNEYPVAKAISPEAYACVTSATFGAQFFLFAKRAVIQHLRKIHLFLMELLLMIFIGIFIGNAYSSGDVSAVSNSSMMFGFGLCLGVGLVSLRVFGAELIVYWREAAPGAGMELSKLAYFLAKNLIELPRVFLLTVVCALQYYPTARIICGADEFLLQSFFLAWNGAGLAMCLSVAYDIKLAQLIYVVLCLIFLLEAGVFTLLKNMGIVEEIMSWLSPIRWFVEGVTTCSVAQLGPGTRLPASWYGKKTDSSYVLLRGLWFSEALFKSPATDQEMRERLAMYSERYHQYQGSNNTGWEVPNNYPQIRINVIMNFMFGIIWRIIAFYSLAELNRDKMGQREWSEIFMTEYVKPVWKKYITDRGHECDPAACCAKKPSSLAQKLSAEGESVIDGQV